MVRFYRDLKATKQINLEDGLDFEQLPIIKDRQGNYFRALIVKNDDNTPFELTNVELDDKRIYVEVDNPKLNPNEKAIVKFAVKENAQLDTPIHSKIVIKGRKIYLPFKKGSENNE